MAETTKPDEGDRRRGGAVDSIATQRAYTLRLQGREGAGESWRDALWTTHQVANAGAKAFGDWLLTLRGGLCRTFAEGLGGSIEGPPSDTVAAERRARRTLLVLSWLSVEDLRGSPDIEGIRVAVGTDSTERRRAVLLDALESILRDRGLGKSEIATWQRDCGDSLAAPIRDDAVWINRSRCFDILSQRFEGLTRAYAQSTVMEFFGPERDYFAMPDTEGLAESGGSDGPEFKALARQWCSTNFGTGEKSDSEKIVAALRKLGSVDFNRFAGKEKKDLIATMAETIGSPASDLEGLRRAVG